MKTFKYKAKDSIGNINEGMIEAYDAVEAAARIRSQYDIVTEIKEIKTAEGEGGGGLLSMEIGGKKLNGKAFTLMCSQFATILKAGIPIARAVKLIAEKTADKTLKAMLLKVAKDVEAGRTLSSSFEEHGGDILPATFSETLRAGEESGDISSAFESIYKHFDKQTTLNDKVRSAMMYPMFVMLVAVVVVIVLMVYVVPKFTAIFDDLGGEMPMMTKILIAISTFVQKTWIGFVLIILLIVIGIKMYGRSEQGAMKLAQIKLNLPVLGNIESLNAASLFANTMATMIGAGLPMTKSVYITGKVMTNAYIADKVSQMIVRIEEGRTVVDAMREADCLPDILTDMVGVGEETGEMKQTLDTVALYYDNELEVAITEAVGIIEPAALLFVAAVAGFIVLAIYMSMFGMYSAM